jgi:hypothetical protein
MCNAVSLTNVTIGDTLLTTVSIGDALSILTGDA